MPKSIFILLFIIGWNWNWNQRQAIVVRIACACHSSSAYFFFPPSIRLSVCMSVWAQVWASERAIATDDAGHWLRRRQFRKIMQSNCAFRRSQVVVVAREIRSTLSVDNGVAGQAMGWTVSDQCSLNTRDTTINDFRRLMKLPFIQRNPSHHRIDTHTHINCRLNLAISIVLSHTACASPHNCESVAKNWIWAARWSVLVTNSTNALIESHTYRWWETNDQTPNHTQWVTH